MFTFAKRANAFCVYIFTFDIYVMHRPNAFMQSDIQCIHATDLQQYVCSLEIKHTTFAFYKLRNMKM